MKTKWKVEKRRVIVFFLPEKIPTGKIENELFPLSYFPHNIAILFLTSSKQHMPGHGISPWEHTEKQQQYTELRMPDLQTLALTKSQLSPPDTSKELFGASRPHRAPIYPSHSLEVTSVLGLYAGTFQLLFPPASFLTYIHPYGCNGDLLQHWCDPRCHQGGHWLPAHG